MLILMYWGINFLKGKNLFSGSHTFYTTFDNVEGLNVSADVLFRGIKVGTVTDITFDPKTPEYILVEFTVGRKYPLPNDSYITTDSPILGNRTLIVAYGHSPEMYRNGDRLPSVSKPGMLGQLTDGLGPVKEQLTAMVSNLNRTLSGLDSLLSAENLENISGTLAHVRVLSGKLQTSVDNVNAITGNLRDNGDNITRIVENVGDFTDSLKTLELAAVLDNLNSTVHTLNAAVAKINEGDGSAALLLNDPALYEGLQASSENLSLLLGDLRANPGRYVHFSLFGRKNK